MLEPQSRHLLLDSLRPPDGYSLDCAVGTTYSLDLLALLSVPLAFTFSEWEDSKGNLTEDNMALLESIKRHSNRLCVFCQAGQISVPKKDQRLFAYLEQVVVEVTPKKELGVFHPKIWLLRYVSNKDETAVKYRFLCLSRNLTYDRSWDTILVMDGDLEKRQNAFSVNHPLGDFIRALPGLAVSKPVSENVQQIVNLIQEDVRKVSFSPPEGFNEYAFWPIGLSERPVWPFGNDKADTSRRMLIISPFLRDGFLKRVTENRKNGTCILVSRADELDQIPSNTLDRFTKYTLSSSAVADNSDIDAADEPELSGLHAKLFLMDDSDDRRHMARLWTGSANATNSAFPDSKRHDDRGKGNVEFLVELAGPRGKFGIDRLMTSEKGTTSLIDMLDQYVAPEEVKAADPVKKRLEQELDAVRRSLASGILRALVAREDDQISFSLTLNCDSPVKIAGDIAVKCWPVSSRDDLASNCALKSGQIARFRNVTMDALSAFFAFETSLARGGKKAVNRFVVKADLQGDLEGRFAHLVRSLLKDRNHVLRMLMMLLADKDLPPGEGGGLPKAPTGAGSGGGGFGELPLLESLLRALDKSPDKIDRINALVNDISSSPDGAELLPLGFVEIWPAVWASREALKCQM